MLHVSCTPRGSSGALICCAARFLLCTLINYIHAIAWSPCFVTRGSPISEAVVTIMSRAIFRTVGRSGRHSNTVKFAMPSLCHICSGVVDVVKRRGRVLTNGGTISVHARRHGTSTSSTTNPPQSSIVPEKSCWSCGTCLNRCPAYCATCHRAQHVDTATTNYFSLFSLCVWLLTNTCQVRVITGSDSAHVLYVFFINIPQLLHRCPMQSRDV